MRAFVTGATGFIGSHLVRELLQNLAGISYLARADKAGRELGWHPRPVEEGMRETIEWLKAVR